MRPDSFLTHTNANTRENENVCVRVCVSVCARVCECVVTFTAQLTAICAVAFVVAASRLTGMRRRRRPSRLIIILQWAMKGGGGGEEARMVMAFISRSVSMRNACEYNTSSSSSCRCELVKCQTENDCE